MILKKMELSIFDSIKMVIYNTSNFVKLILKKEEEGKRKGYQNHLTRTQ
jgi:hypothetical protein